MLKYYLLTLCYCILRVQGIDLEFTGCNTNGWSCQNSTNGIGIDIIYRCTKEFEKQNPNVTWRYNGIPYHTESIAIENCNIELTLDTNLPSLNLTKNETTENVSKKLSDYVFNFRSIAIRKVKELKLNPNFKDLLSRLRGNASVLFEDVELIKVLPSHIIEGPSPYIKTNRMKSLNFTMKRVKIQHAEDRAILWAKENAFIIIDWENVHLESSATSIEIIGTTTFWPHSEIQETENNQVYIRNCTFKTMATRTFILSTTVFHFTDNHVESFNSYAIDINSPVNNISGNTFNKLNNYAFGHTMLGKNKESVQFNFNTIVASEGKALNFEDILSNLDRESRVSFHGNNFKCRNADWIHRSKNDTENMISLGMNKGDYEYLKSFENIFLMNADNICTDFKFPISIRAYTESYLKHGKVPDRVDLSK